MNITRKLGDLFLSGLGWEIQGTLPDIPKYIVAVVPHTSWFDFVIGVLIRASLGADIKFLAKKSLFRFPWGWFFRWMGGYPVDRTVRKGLVQQVSEIYRSKDRFAIAIAPEGTRKKVRRLKTGFYFIAKETEIPIVLARMDYATKILRFSDPIFPGDDIDDDLRRVYRFFRGAKGKHPSLSFEPDQLDTFNAPIHR